MDMQATHFEVREQVNTADLVRKYLPQLVLLVITAVLLLTMCLMTFRIRSMKDDVDSLNRQVAQLQLSVEEKENELTVLLEKTGSLG